MAREPEPTRPGTHSRASRRSETGQTAIDARTAREAEADPEKSGDRRIQIQNPFAPGLVEILEQLPLEDFQFI
jgi:hypothetical protein